MRFMRVYRVRIAYNVWPYRDSMRTPFPWWLQRLWQYGDVKEVIGPLRVVHRYVNMVEQTAEYYNETTQRTETVSQISFRYIFL